MPDLAIERWRKATGASADAAVALVVEAAHGQLIHAATRAAQERGARIGGRLTDARALDPTLQAVPADVAGDADLLARLGQWASRWSPLVEVDGEDGLRLDITGVPHLFGGEARLVRDIERRFAALGLTVRVAIASTAAAAWGLARYGDGGTDLGALPVAALRLPQQALHTLNRLGLKRIGDLTGIRRSSLARRFREADNPLDALDRMLGKTPEPLTAAPFEPPPRALLRLKEPVNHHEAAPQALDLLVPKLVKELEQRKLGARQLALCGFRVDGSVALASVATAIPSREPGHLRRLLEDKAAALDPGFGFDGFALEASWWERLDAAQESLVEEPSGEREVARLVDRLSVKLGPDKVRRPAPRESHIPERANGWEAALSHPLPLAGGAGGAQRSRGGLVTTGQALPSHFVACPSRKREGDVSPQRLLDRPEAIAVIYATPDGLPRRFVWRRAVHDIARAQGPERIAPEWWRERSTARLRDYYKVEDKAGRRFWIYREGLVDDGRGGPPVWFIHGLFG